MIDAREGRSLVKNEKKEYSQIQQYEHKQMLFYQNEGFPIWANLSLIHIIQNNPLIPSLELHQKLDNYFFEILL